MRFKKILLEDGDYVYTDGNRIYSKESIEGYPISAKVYEKVFNVCSYCGYESPALEDIKACEVYHEMDLEGKLQ